jgi:hypothetical protein
VLKFVSIGDEVRLRYRPDFDQGWVEGQLRDHGSVTINRVFTFERADLVDAAGDDETDERGEETGDVEDLDFEDTFDADWFDFRFARRRDGYLHIDGRIFDIDNKVLIVDGGLTLERKLFIAERNISVMARIADLLPPEQDIVIGGDRDQSVPVQTFMDLIKRFPGTTELNRYAASRISTVLGDHFALMADARARYETYMDKARSNLKSPALEQPELLQIELQKYVLIHDTIQDWLSSGEERSEKDWQKMLISFLLLIFPKYVAVLENVRVVDYYGGAGGKPTDRFIDLALVDASGNLDVIELKKPLHDALVGKRPYRDNSVPARELSGSIMQAEKYLFHLSKWGVEGEKKLSAKYKDELPPGMTIRVTNPKAMIIIGRDRRIDGSAALAADQMFDLEVIKRKYANMMDIMTYDDLLRRLQNIIASLRKRVEEASYNGL